MRRFALVSLLALLSGCGLFANPLVGSGEFIGETHTWRRDPNRPIGNSENMLRAEGRNVAVAPVEAEPGNIWPGAQPPDPTLEDIERQQNLNQPQGAPGLGQTPNQPSGQVPVQAQPNAGLPRVPRGSSTPPTADQAVVPPAPYPGPASAPAAPPNIRTPAARSFSTPSGPAVTNPGGNGVTTYQAPGGGTGIVVPNGNGTSTLVAPDGTVTTVPNPK